MAAPSTEDVRLLFCLVRGDAEGTDRCLGTRSTSLDTFVQLVERHGLAVVVLRAIEQSRLSCAFGDGHLETLRRRSRERAVIGELVLANLQRLSQRFAAEGQDVILLKGPYLAARFYGDPLGREYRDLDLLVLPADLDRVSGSLASAGFTRKSRVLLAERLTRFFVHGFDFSDGSTKVDLHWSLSRHPSFRLADEAIWAGRQSYPVAGRDYDVLSDEHEIVFAVLSALRDLERARPKLKNFVDLLRLLEAADSMLDWDQFFAVRRADNTLGPAVNVIALVLALTGAEGDLPALRSAVARRASRVATGRPGPGPLLFWPAASRSATSSGASEHTMPLRRHGSHGGFSRYPFRLSVHGRRRRQRS